MWFERHAVLLNSCSSANVHSSSQLGRSGGGNVSIIRGFNNPISSIRVSRVRRVGRVRVTLTVTVTVSRVSVMVSVRDSVK